MHFDHLKEFATIFISIVLEAIPFIILGSLISALIQVFISEERISRILPKNKFIGVIGASLMGIFFPVCECAIVPIARRLIKKGVPLSMAITFMISVPIVNPIVLLSTYYAFQDKPAMVLIRGGFGLLSSIVIGLLIGVLEEGKNPLKEQLEFYNEGCACGYDHKSLKFKPKFIEVIEHTTYELYDIGKYLIIGAMISAAFNTIVSRNIVTSIGQHGIYSIIVMMIMAYIISLCSEADAFIARTFLGQFTTGAIAAFLILGPMIDIKNTLLLLGGFKKSFVIKLMFVIFAVVYIMGSLVNAMGFLR